MTVRNGPGPPCSAACCGRRAARSAGSSMVRRASGSAGVETASSARASQCRQSRSTVAASNRPELYSATPTRAPSPVSWKCRPRSNWAAARGISYSSAVRPGRTKLPPGVFWSVIMACTSGVRLGSRSGASSSMRRLNGTSWWAKASSVVLFTSSSRSAKVRAASTWLRRTSVLTKKPTRPSSSVRSRPETAVPRAMSRRPV